MVLGFLSLFIVIFGCCVGSFLNVLIYRLPRGLPFATGRSFCPKCRKKISWFDNIPLLSFFLLKGRCRHCHSPISWRYPVVELTTGILFLLSYLSHLSFLSYLLFSGLIVVFFIDLEHQIIPDEVLLPLIILFFIRDVTEIFASPLNTYFLILNTFASGVGAFLFMFLIYLITKGKGMGFGDVKLAFLMGLVLGYPKIVVAFYLAFLTGALFGIILILARKATLKQRIAFGPFLTFSSIISLLWGEKILQLTGLL